jgi:hypothetical protein
MPGPRRIGAPPEGSIFGLPLPDGEYVLGVIIQRDARTAHVGFVFEPVIELPSTPVTISRHDLGLLIEVETTALDSKHWPVVSIIDDFDATQWPVPPRLPGDKADTPGHLERWMVDYVRHRRRRVLEDQTWLAEHPHLADPMVGTLYIRLPFDRVRSFVEDRLSRSGTLGEIVLDETDLTEGTFISTLPREVGVEKAADHPGGGAKHFDRGRKLIRGHIVHPDGSREAVHDNQLSCLTMLSEWLGSGSTHLVIFRDWFSDTEPVDRFVQSRERYERLGGVLLTYGAECYGVIPPGAADEPVTMGFLTQFDWSKVGFLARHEKVLDGRGELIASDIRELAEGLEGIVIGAYDGEGYVVWTRTNGDHWIVG